MLNFYKTKNRTHGKSLHLFKWQVGRGRSVEWELVWVNCVLIIGFIIGLQMVIGTTYLDDITIVCNNCIIIEYPY